MKTLQRVTTKWLHEDVIMTVDTNGVWKLLLPDVSLSWMTTSLT